MQKDLRKNKLSLICAGEWNWRWAVNWLWRKCNKKHYNTHFIFREKIQEHPNNVNDILDLFDASAGNVVYDTEKCDSRQFSPNPIHMSTYKRSIVCHDVSSNPRQPCTITYSWYDMEQNKVNYYYLVGFESPPPGVPCNVLIRSTFNTSWWPRLRTKSFRNL